MHMLGVIITDSHEDTSSEELDRHSLVTFDYGRAIENINKYAHTNNKIIEDYSKINKIDLIELIDNELEELTAYIKKNCDQLIMRYRVYESEILKYNKSRNKLMLTLSNDGNNIIDNYLIHEFKMWKKDYRVVFYDYHI